MSLKPFLEYLNFEKKYSKHTVLAYEKDISSFFEFLKDTYGEDDPVKVAYAQIRAWIISLVDSGLSSKSVNRKVSSLKSYYKFLLKTGDITLSPLAKHKALKVSKRVQIPFSEKEVDLVLKELRESQDFNSLRDLLIVELLYGTGMRRAELIDLKISSVDFNQKTLKVVGKRDKERIIPLLPGVVLTLERYLVERSQLAPTGKDAPLLITSKGLKLYNTLVYRVINRYFSEASDKFKTSPHILRHSFATHLLNQGADLNVVKELLGHASLASTQVYTHNSIKALKDVYSKAHPRTKK